VKEARTTRSTQIAEITAPPELVFRLASDVERWPHLLPHYLRANVVERHADGSKTVEFVALRRLFGPLGVGIPVAWRARTSNDPRTRLLRFVHRGGATGGMSVTWRIEPIAGGSRVSIEHLFEGGAEAYARIVIRLFVRPIAGRTLATFRAIAEALATDPLVNSSPESAGQFSGQSPSESVRESVGPPPTNPEI
jgi:ribosome-associated toxin RatA of RatAB toxin-antitoxin module